MTRFIFAGVVAILFVSSAAFGAKEVGNGGQGVLIGRKIVVLDLVESGIEEPLFSDMPPQRGNEARMEEALRGLNAPTALIAQKLQELGAYSPLLSDMLVFAAESYSWRLVSGPLESIPDAGGVFDPGGHRIVQLAVRAGRTVRIDAELWRQMDVRNQAVLILHELIYSLMPLKDAGNGFRSQDAVRAREVNAFLYTEDFRRKSSDKFASVVGDDLALDGYFTGDPSHRNFQELSLELEFLVLEEGTPPDEPIERFRIQWIADPEGKGRVAQGCFRSFSLVNAVRFVRVRASHVRKLKSLQFVDFASPRGLQTALLPVACTDPVCERRSLAWALDLPATAASSGCEDILFKRLINN